MILATFAHFDSVLRDALSNFQTRLSQDLEMLVIEYCELDGFAILENHEMRPFDIKLPGMYRWQHESQTCRWQTEKMEIVPPRVGTTTLKLTFQDSLDTYVKSKLDLGRFYYETIVLVSPNCLMLQIPSRVFWDFICGERESTLFYHLQETQIVALRKRIIDVLHMQMYIHKRSYGLATNFQI